MAITIFVCNKEGVLINYEKVPSNLFLEQVGAIDSLDACSLDDLKKDKNIALLKYVSQFDNVYFNSKQLGRLLVEVEYVRRNSLLKDNLMNILEKAIMIGRSKPHLYLKFKNS